MRSRNFGHCIQITFLPGVFPVNCYLVREDDGLTLIDTGLASSLNAIMRMASSLDAPVQRILLTHGHGDHTRGLDRLHDFVPHAEVLMSERDSRLLVGDTSLDDGEPQAKIKGDLKQCRTRPTGFLKAGDRVGSLEVISCPGHTPGHLAFFDTRDGTLIAGDAFQTHGGIAVAGTIRPFFPFPALATWDKATALTSARHLRDLQPSNLAVGHGNVLAHPLEAMDAAIRRAEQQLSEV